MKFLSNDLLARFSEIAIEPRFVVGEIVARGFADLGSEAFVVLPGSKLLSLFTGEVTTLDSEEAKAHFFRVEFPDGLVALLEERSGLPLELHRVDQQWQATAGTCSARADELITVLLDLFECTEEQK